MNMKLFFAAGCLALGLAACGDSPSPAPDAGVSADAGVISDGGREVPDGGVVVADGGVVVPDGGAPDGGVVTTSSFATFVNGLFGMTNDTSNAQSIDAVAGEDPDTVPPFDALFP